MARARPLASRSGRAPRRSRQPILLSPDQRIEPELHQPVVESRRRVGARARRLARSLRLSQWLPPVVAAGIGVAVWQVVADHDRYLAPHPWQVATQLANHPAFYLTNAGHTLSEAVIGLACGFLVAFVLGVVTFGVPVVRRAVLPLAIMLNVTPIVALAPPLVVAFGFGDLPKVVVTSVICFFPVLINTLAGLRSADPQALEVLRTLGASRLDLLCRLQLPSSLPYLFTAARVAFPLSVVGAVVAEFVAPGSSLGLGTIITVASSHDQLAEVYAAIVLLAAMGVALTGMVVTAERRLLSWHPSRGTNR